METLTQALYFTTAMFISAVNPFLTLLLIASSLMDRIIASFGSNTSILACEDGTLMTMLYRNFVTGLTSFCIVSFYGAPFAFLLFIITKYIK